MRRVLSRHPQGFDAGTKVFDEAAAGFVMALHSFADSTSGKVATPSCFNIDRDIPPFPCDKTR